MKAELHNRVPWTETIAFIDTGGERQQCKCQSQRIVCTRTQEKALNSVVEGATEKSQLLIH
jgi:hypothetical protein